MGRRRRPDESLTLTQYNRVRARLIARGLRVRVRDKLQSRGRQLGVGLRRGHLAEAIIDVCRELPKAGGP